MRNGLASAVLYGHGYKSASEKIRQLYKHQRHVEIGMTVTFFFKKFPSIWASSMANQEKIVPIGL